MLSGQTSVKCTISLSDMNEFEPVLINQKSVKVCQWIGWLCFFPLLPPACVVSFFVKGHTWCAHECFDCSEIIEAESKTRLKLTFHNHVCSDNYSNNELLLDLCNIEDIVVYWVYWSSSPSPLHVSGGALSKAPKQEQSLELDLTSKAKIQELKTEILPSTYEHKACYPGWFFKL